MEEEHNNRIFCIPTSNRKSPPRLGVSRTSTLTKKSAQEASLLGRVKRKSFWQHQESPISLVQRINWELERCWTQFQHVGRRACFHTKNSPIPTSYARNELNSATIYLEIASHSTNEEFNLTNCPFTPTSDTSHTTMLSSVFLNDHKIDWRFQWPPPSAWLIC